METNIALIDVLTATAYITAEVPLSMKLLKQCCVCNRILMGSSPKTGLENWQPCDRVLPVSHGLCPACAAAYREKADLLESPTAARTA